MKRIIIAFLLLLPLFAGAQGKQYLGATTTTVINRGAFISDSMIVLPTRVGPPSAFPSWYPGDLRKRGAAMYDYVGNHFYIYDGTAWNEIAGTSGSGYTDEQAQDAVGVMVSSEFTYTDATPLLAINTIAQSKITNLVSDLALKAPIASPTFTGVPAAPTAAPGTATTQLATTAFVTSAVSGVATSVTAGTHIGVSGAGTSGSPYSISLANITGMLSSGSRVQITGSGTDASPYVINVNPSVTRVDITSSAGITVSDAALSGKTILFLAVRDFAKFTGYSFSGTTITFSDGTTLAANEPVAVFCQ